jgi:thioredoxin 1
MNEKVVTITEDNFNEIINGDKLTVIDFWAEWCGPCKMVSPILDSLAEEFGDEIVVAKCDVDDLSFVSDKYGIRNIPAVLFIQDGEVVDKIIGANPKEKYVAKINSLI